MNKVPRPRTRKASLDPGNSPAQAAMAPSSNRRATPEETRALLGNGLILPVPQRQPSSEKSSTTPSGMPTTAAELKRRVAALNAKSTVAGPDSPIYKSGLTMTSVRAAESTKKSRRKMPKFKHLKPMAPDDPFFKRGYIVGGLQFGKKAPPPPVPTVRKSKTARSSRKLLPQSSG